MKKLTAQVARMELANLKALNAHPSHGISIKAELFMQALEIALPVLEQQESSTDTSRQIENDGWIEWSGDCDPSDQPAMGIVRVKFRDGSEGEDSASKYYWKKADCNSDIIAYRVIENDGREG